MKNIYLKTLALSLTLFIFACGGDDPSDLSTCSDNALSLTYNGDLYTADAVQTSLTLGSSTGTLTGTITGSTIDNRTFTITIFNPNKPDKTCLDLGEYPGAAAATLSDNRFQATYSEDVFAGSLFFAFNGTLNISSCTGDNKIIEGTFSFQDDTGAYVVTDGTFNVCLEE